MGLFDMFKKKADAPQKTLTCARCKKEISDEESKWIGNHRFCTDCAAPPKVATNKVPVKSKKDKPSGTGKLLNSLSCCKSNIISLDSEDYIIYYRIQFESKCDKMIITYQVDDKTAYAKGVLYYLQSNKKDLFVNLI